MSKPFFLFLRFVILCESRPKGGIMVWDLGTQEHLIECDNYARNERMYSSEFDEV
jgi:hypothetical protein